MRPVVNGCGTERYGLDGAERIDDPAATGRIVA
jgi:hypothetical protein